ncbi:MAG: phosphoribosyltransferase family protein [Pseudonocardiales bacterium]
MHPDRTHVPDRRDNRLTAHLFTNTPDLRRHHLDLRCSNDIAGQFLDLGHCGVHYRRVEPANNEWTHRLEAEGPADPQVRSLADLLQKVITLRAPSPMSVALVLASYRTPVADIEPNAWPYTTTADMVRRGKYWKEKPRTVEAAGRWLADRLGEVLTRHPTLATADVVVVVPGHDRTLLSFGERLAATVGAQHGLTEIRVQSRREFRPEAKSRGSDHADDLDDEFSIAEQLSGCHALVIDDVVRSGTTLRAVAKAARAAGAGRISGLVCVRTLRS